MRRGQNPHIVITGAGFGGLQVVRRSGSENKLMPGSYQNGCRARGYLL